MPVVDCLYLDLSSTAIPTSICWILVNIPRQSRGLYDVSRSKRLLEPLIGSDLIGYRGSRATRFLGFAKDRNSTLSLSLGKYFSLWRQQHHLIRIDPSIFTDVSSHGRRTLPLENTPVNLKVRLSPRQSRGFTHVN